MAFDLVVEDKRGNGASLGLVITDNGFRLTHYGNEVLDATDIKKNGEFVINGSRAKHIETNGGFHIYKIEDY